MERRMLTSLLQGQKFIQPFPEIKYEFHDGTSMAAALVTGVASLIRSYYPKLTARQVKEIILNSGKSIDSEVIIPGDSFKAKHFREFSATGRIINALSAVLLAESLEK